MFSTRVLFQKVKANLVGWNVAWPGYMDFPSYQYGFFLRKSRAEETYNKIMAEHKVNNRIYKPSLYEFKADINDGYEITLPTKIENNNGLRWAIAEIISQRNDCRNSEEQRMAPFLFSDVDYDVIRNKGKFMKFCTNEAHVKSFTNLPSTKQNEILMTLSVLKANGVEFLSLIPKLLN